MTPTSSCLPVGLRHAFLAVGFSLPLPAVEPDFLLAPTADHAQLGSGFAALGDLDGDGVTDLAVTDPSFRAPGNVLASGIVHVVSGADGTTLRSHQGSPGPSQYFGLAVAALDADGDGIQDLAVGAPGHSVSGTYGVGCVTIYSGADGSELQVVTGTGPAQYGSSLANAGDQDGDGIDDLFVGAGNSNGGRGTVFIQSGADGSHPARFETDTSLSEFGSTLATLGDLDGDGRAELAVGAPGFRTAGNFAGRVQIIRTSDGSVLAQRVGTAIYHRLGESLAAVADADGDSSPDLLVGAYSGGSAFVVSGRDLSLIADLALDSLPAYQAIRVGGSLDFDGDGTADWLIGSPGLGIVGTRRAGGIRIISGADRSTLFERLATAPLTNLGSHLQVLPGFGFAAGENARIDPLTGGRGLALCWKIAQEIPELDTDGDGVTDDLDAVPESIMDATVKILGFDSGVENRVDPDGTTLADRYAALGGWSDYRSPAFYLLNAAFVTAELRIEKLITRTEAHYLNRAALFGVIRTIWAGERRSRIAAKPRTR